MDEELLDEVKAAAESEGTTVSAWLAELARDRLALLGLDRVVTDWEQEHGKITVEEIAAVEAEWAQAAAEARRRTVLAVERSA